MKKELEKKEEEEAVYISGTGSLNRQAEHTHNTVHGLVLPSDRAAAVCRVVPEARAGRVKTGAVLLHDHACNYFYLKINKKIKYFIMF
jgi:hypothetical protein